MHHFPGLCLGVDRLHVLQSLGQTSLVDRAQQALHEALLRLFGGVWLHPEHVHDVLRHDLHALLHRVQSEEDFLGRQRHSIGHCSFPVQDVNILVLFNSVVDVHSLELGQLPLNSQRLCDLHALHSRGILIHDVHCYPALCDGPDNLLAQKCCLKLLYRCALH